MDRSFTERSQTDRQIQRLYPSLPNSNKFEVCVLNQSSPEVTHHIETLGISEAEGCAARLKEQIKVLEKQKRELIYINERWAKEYGFMVQYYKDKLRNLNPSLPQQNCLSKDNHLCKLITLKDSTQAGCGDVSDVLVKAQSEVRQLQEQNRALARRGQYQDAEITRLNKALEETLLTYPEISPSQDMRSETLQDLWKHQAEVNKEDFLKERKDREMLKGKYLELEKKYKKVRNELFINKSQGTWTAASEPQCKCTCTQQDTCPNNKLTEQCFNKPLRRCTFKDKQWQ